MFIGDFGRTITNTAKASINSQMETFIKDISTRERGMEKESIFGAIKAATKGTGSSTKCMAMVNILLQMEWWLKAGLTTMSLWDDNIFLLLIFYLDCF